MTITPDSILMGVSYGDYYPKDALNKSWEHISCVFINIGQKVIEVNHPYKTD